MTNSKNTKRALLSSALALLVCVAMLIGTTFAWFTDTASTAVNKIQAGTLDIALEMKDGDEWVSAEGKTLNFKAADGRTNILWEPGCTYELPELRIVNKGNLALKYKVVISGINGDAKLNEAIDWYYSVDLSSVLPGANGWTEPSDLYKLDNFGGEDYLLTEGNAANARTDASVFKIIGKMRTDAGNEYQGLSIEGIAITVYATQYTSEFDSYTNMYDEFAPLPWDGETVEEPVLEEDGVYHIYNANQFVGFMQSTQAPANKNYGNYTVVLDSDIDLGGEVITGVASDTNYFGGDFDGQDHTISNFVIKDTTRAQFVGLFNQNTNYANYTTTGSISNLKVKDATVIGKKSVGVLVGAAQNGAAITNCSVEDSTVVATDKRSGGIVGLCNGPVTGCSIANTSIYNADATLATQNEDSKISGFDQTSAAVSGNTVGANVNVYKGITVTLISTAAELKANMTNMGVHHYVLTADIDLGGATVSGFGSDTNPVRGTFNGAGHTISNFKIDHSGRVNYAGLFNYVDYQTAGVNSVIENLTVRNADVKGQNFVGTIVGGMYQATVRNCVVENSTLVGEKKVGGVVGASWGTIEGCKATRINATATVAADQVGDIFGYQG